MIANRIARQPSPRNLELYHELIFNRRTQSAVAAQFGVSQPRVALIRRQVAEWIDRFTSPIMLPVPRSMPANKRRTLLGYQLHLAIAVHRHDRQLAYGEYLDHWGGQALVLELAPLLDAWEAGTVSAKIVAGLPPREYLKIAVRMARELETLARIASQGPFFDLPDQIHAFKCQAALPELNPSMNTPQVPV